jgi:transcriptional regulator with XRE-family HTH domain
MGGERILVGYKSQLGRLFRDARKVAGLTQVKLASRAGIGLSAVQAVEQGRGRVSSLTAMLKTLGLELRGRQLAAGPIGAALVLARKRRKISRRKLSAALGVSRNTLVAVETGGGLVGTLEAYAAAVAAGLYLSRLGEARPFFVHSGNSSVHHGWETPAELGTVLSEAVGGFDLDPCAGSTDKRMARVKARVLLTVNDDGLNAKWFGTVFCNLPYGRSLPRWIEKCATEAEGGAIVVGLIPCRTDTRYWHDHIAGKADVWMLKGRLKFGDGSCPSPFPSAIVLWGANSELVARLSAALPDAWHVPKRQQRISSTLTDIGTSVSVVLRPRL